MSQASPEQIFDSLTPELINQRKKARAICIEFARDPSKGNLKKLRALFAACGEKVFIEYGFHCDYGTKLFLGDRVFINARATFLDGGEIHIGDDTLIGPNVQILTINHATNAERRLKKENFAKNVFIGKNVWIGAGAIILPGVTIGDGAVIGAGSVVSRNIPSMVTAVGNPARPI